MAKEKEKNKRIVLLDVHAILHRAYHALPDFSSSKGEATGALYGLVSMLIALIKDLKPDYIIACYDLPGPTYRHEAYDNYKAGRKEIDSDLVHQIKRSEDIFKALSIPMYSEPGFEADDMLGTIVEILKNNKDVDIVIASGDMDTMQLIDNKKVQVFTLRKGIKDTILYDEKQVIERFGFTPELLPDYKGLRGDPSDNIIGIKGIGEKTATDLIKNFGTIENIYKKLKKDKEAFLKLGIKQRIIDLLLENEEEADFSKMLATIRRDAPIKFALPEKTWSNTVNIEKVQELFTDLDFRTLKERIKDVIPHTENTEEREEENEENISKELLRETQIALWVLNSNMTNPSLSDIYFYTKTKSFTEAREILFKELEKTGAKKVFDEIEKPLMSVVDRMEKRGVLIDQKKLKKLSEDYHKELSSLEKKIWKESGVEFNINSPKQLGEVLFDKLGIKAKNHKKTSTGVKSTKESELEKMKDEHPVISYVLAYRELQKLLSTYIDNIPNQLGSDGKLHANFIQAGSTTGRMASTNPNLQNIPIKSELGRNIRHAFIADKGFTLLSFDYSQIELRIAAFLSKDEKLISIFKEGGDIHRAVAAEVFGVKPEDVDKEMRRRAKVINFGIIYGMGVNALRTNLGTSREEAQNFYNAYFEKFQGLADYLERIKTETYKKGYTETFFGRKRYFEGIKSKLPYVRAQAERMAINAPIQGTEADIVKIAMWKVDEYLKKKEMLEDVYPLLQVHDELVYEVREQNKSVAKEIKSIMESILSSKETEGVPIIVDAKEGKNWGEMKELEI